MTKHIFGNARVSENAEVSGNAKVYGNAEVSGDAWVSGDAEVSGNAKVYGDAWVSGNVKVSGEGEIKQISDYLTIGPAKSSGRFTTAHKDRKIGVRVNCGCFSGSVEEFSKAIEETHKNNEEHLRQYRAFVYLIKEHFNV